MKAIHIVTKEECAVLRQIREVIPELWQEIITKLCCDTLDCDNPHSCEECWNNAADSEVDLT